MSNLVKLRRQDTSTPWGFRMNGGLEFNQPLYVQKVTGHSLATRAGMKPGDAILQIGRTLTSRMTHEMAKMEIIRSGNELDFIIQRNAVEVSSPNDQGSGISEEHVASGWHGPAQDPNVQSRSFKILQYQLASAQ